MRRSIGRWKKQSKNSKDIVSQNKAITSHMRSGNVSAAERVFSKMVFLSIVSFNTMLSGYLSNHRFTKARKLFDEMPHRDLVSWNVMVSGFARNNDLRAARELFDRMPVRDVVSWNALLSGYVHAGLLSEARKVFQRMPVKDNISWNCLLSAYVGNGLLDEARGLFKSRPGRSWDVVSRNCLMSGLVRKKMLREARSVFDEMPLRDSVSWNVMITGYAQNGELNEARLVFEAAPDRKDVFVWTAMVSGYVQHGSLEDARRVFDEMPDKDSVSWNAMIAGYVQSKDMGSARELFEAMPCRNIRSWNTMLTGYAQIGDVGRAKSIFVSMGRRDSITWTAMITAYAQNGLAEEALGTFVEMQRCGERLNRSAFTCALSACAEIGALKPGKQLHCWMVKSGFEKGCYFANALLVMYSKCGSIGEAYNVFRKMGKYKDIVSWTTMLTGYAQIGDVERAKSIFVLMGKRDSISWTAMIAAYAQNGLAEEALGTFVEMQRCGERLNRSAFTCALSACAEIGALNPGRQLHGWMVKSGFEKGCYFANALLVMYSKCGSIGEACNVFQKMGSYKDIVSWNTMIAGYAQIGDVERAKSIFVSMGKRDSISWAAMITAYAQNGLAEEALGTFVEMQRCGERLILSVYTCALSACAEIGALELGKQLHGRMAKSGFEKGCYMADELLVMYSKCGSIGEAYDVFRKMGNNKDIVSWNNMIAGFARHGFGREALAEFDSMIAARIIPNEVTMVGVLLACSHTGLVETGTKYFYSMKHRYGIKPGPKHYNCMINLLGRAGRLDEAQDLMKNMPFEPDGATWGALLGASRIYGNTELSEKAAKKVCELVPENAGMYVLLSNLYASSGRWSDVQKMRLRMRDLAVKKVSGYSWVEVEKKVHTFSDGDTDHPERDKIYTCLERLVGSLSYSRQIHHHHHHG